MMLLRRGGLLLCSSVAATTLVPPTTLLGGFLGAGKTTALANLLRNRDGLRIAVLVNDVASVNVDAQVLRRSTVDETGVEMVELENGCVCCGPGAGGLAPAVAELESSFAVSCTVPAGFATRTLHAWSMVVKK